MKSVARSPHKCSNRFAHSYAAAQLMARQAMTGNLTWLERLFLLLEEPQSSGASLWVGAAVVALLLMFAAFVTLETVQGLRAHEGAFVFAVAKLAFNGVFTLETVGDAIDCSGRSTCSAL